MNATLELEARQNLTSRDRRRSDRSRRVLFLSSSLLTDRMLQHTRLLDELSENVTPEVWAMSARNPQFRPVWESLPVVTNEFPAIRGSRVLFEH
jgi:hypothetical protein